MTSPLCSLCGHKASSHGSDGCQVIDPYFEGSQERCECKVSMTFEYGTKEDELI